MYALIRKEIQGFFASITGYIVVIVFLVINGLFLWVFPGDFNILESGIAGLEPLFYIAPWLFLFLIPAITMRSFAEEKKTGTLDILLTKPISELEIILSKLLACLILVGVALVPTLVYYYTVIRLGNPVGNIDHGATWGSYLGLLFLALSYSSIGIFASILTDNQVVSFIIAIALCFFVFTGFDSVSELTDLQKIGAYISKLGINEHYKSMSRGVIDTRDLVYFLCLISVFTALTRWFLTNKK